MSSSTLLLVDGLAAVYRAFYAIKGLSTADGLPTNAVFGFVRMMNQLMDKVKPTHMVLVFDGGLPAARMELVPEYKAQRPSMPDDLSRQLPLIDRYLEASSILEVVVDGEEADDVLASIATIYADDFDSILIATSDKDLFQVIDDTVKMIKLSGGNEIMGPDAVKAKTGVTPEQTIEWLALIGDSADNIKGVPGVGAKTATKLLCEHGTVAAMYDNIEKVASERIRGSLLDSKDIVERNIAMIRLKLDIDCVSGLDEMAVKPSDDGLLLALFEELELDGFAKAIREPELF